MWFIIRSRMGCCPSATCSCELLHTKVYQINWEHQEERSYHAGSWMQSWRSIVEDRGLCLVLAFKSTWLIHCQKTPINQHSAPSFSTFLSCLLTGNCHISSILHLEILHLLPVFQRATPSLLSQSVLLFSDSEIFSLPSPAVSVFFPTRRALEWFWVERIYFLSQEEIIYGFKGIDECACIQMYPSTFPALKSEKFLDFPQKTPKTETRMPIFTIIPQPPLHYQFCHLYWLY